jgi:RNA polymerase sigma factor (TIGR02999 family)
MNASKALPRFNYMTDITRNLSQLDASDRLTATQLLPLVYDELRKIAAAQLSHEQPGHTLQATALVHEAWLRLTGEGDCSPLWENRSHFFAAAAEAMRRILVEAARRRKRLKRGGDLVRQYPVLSEVADLEPREDLIALDAALSKLSTMDPIAADLVKLRYFTGLTIAEAADFLKISQRTADRRWAYSRAWLHRELLDSENDKP